MKVRAERAPRLSRVETILSVRVGVMNAGIDRTYRDERRARCSRSVRLRRRLSPLSPRFATRCRRSRSAPPQRSRALVSFLLCGRAMAAAAVETVRFRVPIFDVRELDAFDSDELVLTQADRVTDELVLTDADRLKPEQQAAEEPCSSMTPCRIRRQPRRPAV